MNSTNTSLHAFLLQEERRILDACTRCGKCVEVCPVVPYTSAKGEPVKEVASGVLEFLSGTVPLDGAARSWTHACNGCGECIDLCPEEVNPRKMLLLANARDSSVKTKTPELFRKMARAIKLMVAMQLVPKEFEKIFVPGKPRKADLVFYLGCNALRTPHLLFNSMYLLDALNADYEVVGGPSSCCGVVAAKWEGEIERGGRVSTHTITRFESYQPERVMNWCPTCYLHLGETLDGYRKTSYEFGHVTQYLVERIDTLQKLFIKPVNKRVVLHSHVGLGQVGADVAKLLRCIPGLELIEIVQESGYTCGGSGCSRSPELREKEHAELLERVRQTHADTLVTLYHSCHLAFVGAEKEGDFKVLNFTDLLVEALGCVPHEDRFKHYVLREDWNLIYEEALPYLKANGVDVDPALLERHGEEIFTVAEFRGGLSCFGSEDNHAHAAASKEQT